MGIMASRPLHLRCKDTRLILGYMTAAVSKYERSPSPWQDFNLFILRIRFMASFAKHKDVHPSVIDMERCWSEPATPDSEALATEHYLYLDAFTAFVTVLLQKLDRQVWEHIGPEEDQGFKVLWGMMFDACTVFLMFPQQWPENHIPDDHPVYIALHAIMRYLTPLVSPQTGSVQPWAAPLGRAVTANENRVMITPALHTFHNKSISDQVRLPIPQQPLPQGYVQSLCLLSVQGMDQPIPNPALVASMFAIMAKSVASCIDVAVKAGSRRDIAILNTPAVLEVMRRGCEALVTMDAPQELLDNFQQMIYTLSRS